MGATPIDQLKREALAGIRHHPDDIKSVCDANRPRLMATADAVRALLDKVKK